MVISLVYSPPHSAIATVGKLLGALYSGGRLYPIFGLRISGLGVHTTLPRQWRLWASYMMLCLGMVVTGSTHSTV